MWIECGFSERGLADDAEDVVFFDDEDVIAVELPFRAALFGDEALVALFTVKKGDKVLISKYGGTEVKLNGDDVLIINETDILGIIG